MSTMAASQIHHMTPRVVLSDFATRILPNLSLPHQKATDTRRMMAKTKFHNEKPLDPRDFGYRVVEPPIYTSTEVSQPDNSYGTTSTLGKIIASDDDDDECAAEEVMAAQREWDTSLDMECTRPHFELYKEDPYSQFEEPVTTSKDLFAFIDSHDDKEDVWEEAA